MKKKIIIAIAVIVAITGIICLAIFAPKPQMNADMIYGPSEKTGFIGEKIVGNPESAELVIYEYADFGCSHCAEWNRTLNNLMDKYGEKIALIFRNYDLGFKNGPVAARAATAASVQGYFKEYKDLLFNRQVEWYYEDAEDLNEIFTEYFKEASNGSGDLEKFQSDLGSDSVKTRLKFEQQLGKSIHLSGTPTFRISGEAVPVTKLTETIESALGE